MRRLEWVSDCASCAGLCCELIAFEASDDFAFDKAAGERCRHLTDDARCAVHEQRASRGLRGCGLFECYGAGPRATRLLEGEPLAVRIDAFCKLRALGELAWLLRGAQALCDARMASLGQELAVALAALESVANAPLAALLHHDSALSERQAHALLRRVGAALGGRPARRP